MACFQNQMGGTGLWPVVSGVPPETDVGRTFALVSAATGNARPLTKSGVTPDLTGVKPVPPIMRAVK